jgi:hypothetical protein
MVSTEFGPRIVLVQFGCGLLSGISIAFLKDAYGLFMQALQLDELIIAAFVPPAVDFLAKFIPLCCDHGDYHIFLPQTK